MHPVVPIRRGVVWGLAILMVAMCAVGIGQFESALAQTEVYHRVRQGVVRVSCGDRQGTAFAIESPRQFITAAHVVNSGRKIMLRAFTGPAVRARVVRIDTRTDLAELQTDEPLAVRPLERSRDRTDVSSEVCLLGHPFPGYANKKGEPMLAFTWSCGRVVNRNQGYWVIDAAVNPGQSGAPLVDQGGRWLGVVVRRFIRGENLAQAIESPAVDVLLNQPEIKDFTGNTSGYFRLMYLFEAGPDGGPEHSVHLGAGFRFWDRLELGLRGWWMAPASVGSEDFPATVQTDWGLGLDLSLRSLVGVGNKFVVLRPGLTFAGVHRTLIHKALLLTPSTDCPGGGTACNTGRVQITDLDTQIKAMIRAWLGLDLGGVQFLVDFAYLPEDGSFSGGGGFGLEF